MDTRYSDVVFNDRQPDTVTAVKLNKLRDELSAGIAAGGGGGTGTGDMLKSVYDTNNNGKVDTADSIPWTSVTGKPSTYPPDSTAMLKSVYDTNADNIVDHAALADTAPWSGVTGKPATFPPSVHAPSHLDNGSDPVPVTTTTRTGLAPKLSGTATTYLDGTGVFSTPPTNTGPPGPTGPAGPTAISANANNKATLGTDSLTLVQGTSVGVAATTHAQTVSGDDPQLTNARTPTAHASTHLAGGSDPIALVTISAAGLCVPPDGTTIQISGGKLVGVAGSGPVLSFVTKTAAYTLTSADSGKYFICSGGSWVLTLPAPAAGLNYRVRNDMGISGTTGTITVSPTGGTINGASSLALLPQQECTLITDGTNWRTFGLKREVILGTLDITTSTANGSVLLPVGYRYFELIFTGFVPVTNPDFLVGQLSTNGGSTWITTNYDHNILYNSSATAAACSTTENGANFFISPNNVGNSLANPGQSKLVLFPGSASQLPTWTIDGWGRTGSSADVKWNGGGTEAAGVGQINALKYFANGGNILNCFLTVKGVV